MARAVSVTQLYNYKPHVMPFTGKWKASFGEPERGGSWIIWGHSGNGKTRFALQLCKYLTKFGKVAYNSLEEGASRSMQIAFESERMHEVSRNIILLDQEPIDELIKRLKKHKSPHIIAIDSIQYSGLTYASYKALRAEFPRKLFILISHADGKHPSGRVAKQIRYDSFVKIWVEGYRAEVMSRYGGGKHFIIWPEGAAEYWGDQIYEDDEY
ncbi:hypothetical protein ACT29H_01825 [Thermophagus sp. OGC60D27]|uniref:hypothetical protein n=1 Tax=Thermophagus sp. OGC60D27 TaxID=3458415 RepID=UPI0040380D7C